MGKVLPTTFELSNNCARKTSKTELKHIPESIYHGGGEAEKSQNLLSQGSMRAGAQVRARMAAEDEE